jgi:hypothetical protein
MYRGKRLKRFKIFFLVFVLQSSGAHRLFDRPVFYRSCPWCILHPFYHISIDERNKGKGKGEGHTRTGHEYPEGE